MGHGRARRRHQRARRKTVHIAKDYEPASSLYGDLRERDNERRDRRAE